MKINRKVLSIPPHISTSWGNVTSLQAKNLSEGKVLIITLNNGSVVEIPSLTDETLEAIFLAHTNYVEGDVSPSTPKTENTKQKEKESLQSNPFAFGGENTLTFGFPMKMGNLDSIGSLGGMMQHDPAQANAPNLPKEALEKITSIAKAIGLDKQLDHLPKAEPHCNCPYCQLARAFHGQDPKKEELSSTSDLEEDVSDEDLTFREWDIKETGNNLYDVTNPLDPTEHYQVFLGNPVGCTCGQKNCVHIKAVLET